MAAPDNLGHQFTLHRGIRVVVPTAEIAHHLAAGDHQAAADVVMRHVTNYRETRPQENEQGRFGGLGTHWSTNRFANNTAIPHTWGADTFAGRSVVRDVEGGEDETHVPVMLRAVVRPGSVDAAPDSRRAVFHHSIEGEVALRSNAPVTLRSAHVFLPSALPHPEQVMPDSDWSRGEAPGSVRVVRRMNQEHQA